MTTHAELVTMAANYLKTKEGCILVVTELSAYGGEIPDCIGWRNGRSFMIECKTSLSDFRADQFKTSRRVPDYGPGQFRFYLVTEDILEPVRAALPDGWGLLCAKGKRVKHILTGRINERDMNYEVGILLSLIRRMAGRADPLPCVSVKFYSHELTRSSDNPRATVSIAKE